MLSRTCLRRGASAAVKRAATSTVIFKSLLGMRHVPRFATAGIEGPSWAADGLQGLVEELPPTVTPTCLTTPTRILVVVDKEPCVLGAALRDAYQSLLDDCRAQGHEDAASSPSMKDEGGLVDGKVISFNAATFRDDVANYFGFDAPPPPPAEDRADKTKSAHNNVVVLIENGAFQNELQQYRLRLELFRYGVRVAEHCHLKTMSAGGEGDQQVETYFRSCLLDPFTAEAEGRALRERLANSTTPVGDALRMLGAATASADDAATATPLRVVLYDLVITSGHDDSHELVFGGGVEQCLLNTGLYAEASAEATAEVALGAASAAARSTAKTQQRSVGGTFPVGEVITESVDLGAVNGTAEVFAFPTLERRMCILPVGAQPAPSLLSITVDGGCLTTVTDPTPDGRLGGQGAQLKAVLDLIKDAEGGSVWIRELGIGLNPFLGESATLADVTSFERQRGIHVSLGKRHPLFPKKARSDVGIVLEETADGTLCGRAKPSPQVGPVLRRKDGIFHIDLFIAANKMVLRPKEQFSHLLKEEVLMDFRKQ